LKVANRRAPVTPDELRCIIKSRERALAPFIPDCLAVGGAPDAPGFAGSVTVEAPAGLQSRVQHRIRGPSVLERQGPERTPANRTDGEVWPGVERVWPTGGTDPPAGDRLNAGPSSP
jgi:hypothetical protein